MGLRAPAFTSSCMADAASQSVLSSLLMRMNWGTSERGDRGATRMPGDTAGSAAGRRRGGGGGLCVCEGSGGEGERRRSRKHPSPTRKTAAPTPLPHLSCRLPRRCCKGGREGGGGGGGRAGARSDAASARISLRCRGVGRGFDHRAAPHHTLRTRATFAGAHLAAPESSSGPVVVPFATRSEARSASLAANPDSCLPALALPAPTTSTRAARMVLQPRIVQSVAGSRVRSLDPPPAMPRAAAAAPLAAS